MSTFFQKITSWHDIREKVASIKPELAAIIDAWDPPENYVLIQLRYPYGKNVVTQGTFNIPCEQGETYPVHHDKIPKEIRQSLSYRTIPLGLITHNGNEVYLDISKRLVPLVFFNPGVLLGLWETLDPPYSHFPKKIWSVAAGARNTFLLPKISETLSHERLKKFMGVRSPVPKHLQDHWKIFAEISQHKDFPEPWFNEIIFFSHHWLEEDKNNPHWLAFHRYLLSEGWELSAYQRNAISRDVIWEFFSQLLSEKGMKPTTYTLSTLKHLSGISIGAIPGFTPAYDEQMGLPAKGIGDIYTDIYHLSYSPIIMRPRHFSPSTAKDSTYYSLHAPTMLETIPRSKTITNITAELRDLKYLWQAFINDALEGKLRIDGTPLQQILDNINLQFYHSETDIYEEIHSTALILKDDPTFAELVEQSKQKKFAEASPFLRGCIRISRIYGGN